jgi:hypothetical protein
MKSRTRGVGHITHWGIKSAEDMMGRAVLAYLRIGEQY